MVGETLAGRYELEELVGRGGMSSVYRAHDLLLDRTVALKVLHAQFGADDGSVERFRREARAVAALSHPNIVTVIDRGEEGDRQFIVFEYVDGENLKQLIRRRGPAPIETAIELAAQIARALAFAHEHGLVHRDVKPQNVLLNGNGQAKVTDFGIARSLDMQQGLTQTGTVLGTSDYIAPEQAQGRPVDEHTDIYSLGVVLYELLTNEVPFPGENFVAVAMRHINEPPPPLRDKRPEVPPRLEAAVQRAMAKDASDRFPSMTAFCEELEACLADLEGTEELAPPQPLRPRRRRRVSPWPIVLVTIALMAIGAIVAVAILRGIPSWPGRSHGANGGGAAVALTAVGTNDPYGTGVPGEHDELVPDATDGNPQTYWETETYHDAPSLGKPGVGLVLDAGRDVRLRGLTIETGTPGFTAEIRAGDSPTDFPDEVSGAQTVDDGTRFAVSGGRHRYYEIWITRLGPDASHAEIAEVEAN
jgi:serine/threonine-protein kinase